MSRKRGSKARFRKTLITTVKWLSAIVPVCAFIYILYYYKQFDFLKKKPVVKSRTEVVTQADSISALVGSNKEKLLNNIKIMENEWHTVGGIAIHSLTINNATAATVKNLEIEFKYLSGTQSVLTSKIVTIKTPLPPKKSTKVGGISVGYVNNSVVGCDLKVINGTF
ncbi:hypothetical protein FEM33_22790 [Dyadobacter flavalbus]|uniref:Uncharacterized protein n=1 Tax=Dyadobacter flavalbus TaxID=2579942 RepID=A0A5M8QGR1_9BACT|nr:hypothetical protein [Dyadobacter flavalbus]KAA6434110.1 hypothetical protein FEM33_22790 [Dyadobacter flavalbus]